MATNIMAEHFKEMSDLKWKQKQQWKELLKNQEKALIENDNVSGLAAQFAKEREDHNKHFEKEKANLLKRQQLQLSEFKKGKQLEHPDNELER